MQDSTKYARAKKIIQNILTLLIVGLLIFSFYKIKQQLHNFTLEEILTHISEIPFSKLAAAFFFTMLNYFILTGYDFLGFRAIGIMLPYLKIAPIAFLGYVFSYNVGFALLGSAAIRLRFYSEMNLEASQIAHVIVFNTFTYWMGFVFLCGTIFVLDPLSAAAWTSLNPHTIEIMGECGLVAVLIYFLLSKERLSRFASLKRFEDYIFPVSLKAKQLLLSVIDIICSAYVFYLLLPDSHVPFVPIVAVFIIACAAGYLSHVPAGIGVFDSIILVSLSGYFPASKLAGAIIIFRVIFFLIPFLIGVAGFTLVSSTGLKKFFVDSK